MVKADLLKSLCFAYGLVALCSASKYLVINDIHLDVNATYTMPNPGQETNIYLL